MTIEIGFCDRIVKEQKSWRITLGEAPCEESNELVREALVNVEIAGVGSYRLLCTPLELEALAVGFALSEGLLFEPNDVVSVRTELTGFWSAAVHLELRTPPGDAMPRNLIITSSCGLCGSQIEAGLTGPEVGRDLHIAGHQLIRMADRLWQQQALFVRTGGTHAAGIFDRKGEIVAFAEDSGRHNALDKAVGKMLLEGQSTKGCGVIISGRISYELVVKSARAGLEIVAGVSAPSALAAEAAVQRNMTLCGFVRSDRATVYTHPFRIAELPE